MKNKTSKNIFCVMKGTDLSQQKPLLWCMIKLNKENNVSRWINLCMQTISHTGKCTDEEGGSFFSR